MTLVWTERDQKQLKSRGVSPDEAQRQLKLLRERRQFPCLVRACGIGDGIRQLAEDEHAGLQDLFRSSVEQGRWLKFVPASGAASRMFALKTDDDLHCLVDNLDRFAFYRDLVSAASRRGYVLAELRASRELGLLRDLLLGASGLDYNRSPKALLPFHDYGVASRTAFEEQLREAARCFADHRRQCRAHFTVSPEHQHRFEGLLAQLLPALHGEADIHLEVTFSQQKPSTDLLVLDQHNEPLRTETGDLVFRPGGHGALLDNLNELGGDLVFVKNIDNIGHARWQANSDDWIGVVCGHLVHLQTELHRHLAALETQPLQQASVDAERWIRATFPGLVSTLAEPSVPARRAHNIQQLLHRPLRVCGVVLNQGEPGGSPFWVRESDQSHSLQIVENAEVAPHDSSQQQIFAAATHFNPVFMALGLRNQHNIPFALHDFVGNERILVASKTMEGRHVRVLERPGLWNGSMARWNTVFVEVPKEVFTPVKTVFDLLRPEHQPRPEVS
jgi:hypothetical protein